MWMAALRGRVRATILCHGPGRAVGENYPDSEQPVLELLNRFGADGWELMALLDYPQRGDGSSCWEASRLLTIYTFKRSVDAAIH